MKGHPANGDRAYSNSTQVLGTERVQLASCFLGAERTQIAPKFGGPSVFNWHAASWGPSVLKEHPSFGIQNTVEVNTCPLKVCRMSLPLCSWGWAWSFFPLFWVPFAPVPHIGSFLPPVLGFWDPFHIWGLFCPLFWGFGTLLQPFHLLGPFCTPSTYRVLFVPVLGPFCTCSTHRVPFCTRSTYRVCFCPRFGPPVPRVWLLSYFFSHSGSRAGGAQPPPICKRNDRRMGCGKINRGGGLGGCSTPQLQTP